MSGELIVLKVVFKIRWCKPMPVNHRLILQSAGLDGKASGLPPPKITRSRPNREKRRLDPFRRNTNYDLAFEFQADLRASIV